MESYELFGLIPTYLSRKKRRERYEKRQLVNVTNSGNYPQIGLEKYMLMLMLNKLLNKPRIINLSTYHELSKTDFHE